MSIIKLLAVSKHYGQGASTSLVLNNVSLTVNSGELVAIMGRSGSGKSTLLNILGALDRVSSGTYHFTDTDMTSMTKRKLAIFRNKKVGFVFQNFCLIPEYTALENVELALRYAGMHGRKSRSLALEMLEKVGIINFAKYRPNQLSGGQQQRVAVARALVNDPELILADEPTGSLDEVSGDHILKLLLEEHQKGRTVIIVTHDPQVGEKCGRLVRMRDGQIIEEAS